eukprot:1137798-Pelagomonas_calceolata.AAC.4
MHNGVAGHGGCNGSSELDLPSHAGKQGVFPHREPRRLNMLMVRGDPPGNPAVLKVNSSTCQAMATCLAMVGETKKIENKC